MDRPLALFVVGTRPDSIKSAPVILEFRRHADVIDTLVVGTGQHRQMQDQALGAFGISPDVDLDAMRHGQSLASLSALILEGLDSEIEARKPAVVLAQGDTTTTFCAGLCAFYRRVPFAHIEAGLRTDDVFDPFPEEFNRRAVGMFARLHFAPTRSSARALEAEGAPGEIFVTGNTAIDAVQMIGGMARPLHAGRARSDRADRSDSRLILLTTHRRENWGEPQQRIAAAVLQLAERFDDVRFVVPLHPNPIVRESLGPLANQPRFELIEPPGYADFAALLKRCHLVLTDSGGLQEEAPAFGKPVLVLRKTTERPEGVKSGNARLVGTEVEAIVSAASELLTDQDAYERMATARSPYGDGRAAERIRFTTLALLGIPSEEAPMWGS